MLKIDIQSFRYLKKVKINLLQVSLILISVKLTQRKRKRTLRILRNTSLNRKQSRLQQSAASTRLRELLGQTCQARFFKIWSEWSNKWKETETKQQRNRQKTCWRPIRKSSSAIWKSAVRMFLHFRPKVQLISDHNLHPFKNTKDKQASIQNQTMTFQIRMVSSASLI